MTHAINHFINRLVAVDIEVHPVDHQIIKIGAFAPGSGETLAFKGAFNLHAALSALDDFCRKAAFLLGHNITRHDLECLKSVRSDLKLYALPLIDTLWLSPLAFPKNPYHHLVKDYKIVKQSVNDPLADARCTVTLFEDQCEAFAHKPKEIAAFYGGMLAAAFPQHGYAALFEAIVGRARFKPRDGKQIWRAQTDGRVCKNRADDVYDAVAEDAPNSVCLAYMLAWLGVAGDNSVLPPWVRHAFPQINSWLDTLRNSPCVDLTCSYCRAHHNPVKNLKRFFGFDAFLPVKSETPPLQQQITQEILEGANCLAVMPTGAGKSLCFQLPALMRAVQRKTLTLIISPLQSLMKDQVDSLKSRGVLNVGAINSLLTMLERSQVLEGVRLGDIDLVWLAPEQLRNTTVKKVLKQREIGLLVIDEAHCLSKWGHDFRPDYLYIARFITEISASASQSEPQIVGFTATAKKEVVKEIIAYFANELDRHLVLFDGGHERANLTYFVEQVAENEKIAVIHQILSQVFTNTGSRDGAIVFTATRKKAEQICEQLTEKGWAADYFHGGRTPDDKKQVQDLFLQGVLDVIAATNAFGMGVDKPNVRVVIHADTPGSLENYLQEAGRAGRDRQPAQCFLLYHPDDMETQFKLSSLSRLRQRDIAGMFNGLKRLTAKHPEKTVVMTSGELLSAEEMEKQNLMDLSVEESHYDTKVKTAIAWLDRCGKIARGDNRTQVIQGRVLVNSLNDGIERIQHLKLSVKEKSHWENLLRVLFQSGPKELLNTDQLALNTGLEPAKIISLLHAMKKAGLLNHDLNMTAYLHYGVADSSQKRFNQYQNLENALIAVMTETDPDVGPDQRVYLRPRQISQQLRDRGEETARPDRIYGVLELWASDGLLRHRKLGENTHALWFRQDWEPMRKAVEKRNWVCQVIIDFLIGKLAPHARGKDLLVAFQSGELIDALERDMATAYLDHPEQRMQNGLLALDKMRAVSLQSGMAVFRPAMTIRMLADNRERFLKAEFKPLEAFFNEKIVHVHIIGRYAEFAMQKISQAMTYVADYFTNDRESFLKRYFKDQSKALSLPCNPQTYCSIVTSLNNPLQEKIVTAKTSANRLVIAGPGSGKTRVIVHRIAYLIRVKQARPSHILAVAFNRGAVSQLRTRLRDLIGRDAAWVRIRTYHSLAMAITGSSLAGRTRIQDKNTFNTLLREAIHLIESESQADHGALTWRDTLLPGLRYILVDEYQDINAHEYRLLALLAGQAEKESVRAPTLLTVGDDDQNIYAWQGSHVKYIRRFQEEYDAELIEMTANFRSSPAILEASHALITQNNDRLKQNPVTCAANAKNRDCREPVTVIRAPDAVGMFKAALETARSLLDENFDPGQICILCRTNSELDALLIMARGMGLDVKGMRPRHLPLPQIRELAIIMDALRLCRKQEVKPETLAGLVNDLIDQSGFACGNIWMQALRAVLKNHLAEHPRNRRPVDDFINYIYDASRDYRQFEHIDPQRILISTMHSAKGLEFPAVILVGQPFASEKIEDERRLYYVGMTRAKGRLYCLCHDQRRHPFMDAIISCGPQAVQVRREHPQTTSEDREALNTLIWDMTLADVVISFPAFDPIFRKAQPLLAALEPGASQGLNLIGYRICHNGQPIAQLSKKGREQLKNIAAKRYQVAKITFLAAVRWNRPASETLAQREFKDTWLTGLFQVLFRKRVGPTA